MLKKTLRLIEEFIKIPPKNLKRSVKLSNEISEKSQKIEKYFEKKETEDKYSKILKKIERNSQKIANDLERSNSSNLKPEWKKLASQDLLKLKSDIIELQEFLQENRKIIEKKIKQEKYGFDPQSLIKKLENDEEISKDTRSNLNKLLKNLSDKEVENKIENNKKRLRKISKLFIIKREVKNDF